MGSITAGLENYQKYRIAEELAEQQLDDWKEMYDYQITGLQKMFPFTSDVSHFAQSLFGGGGFEEIEDYLMERPKPTNLERQLFEFFGGDISGKKPGKQQKIYKKYGAPTSGPLAGRGPELLGEASDYLRSLFPYAEDWAETGFKTDIQPIQDYAMRMFEREMMPAAAERFGGDILGSGYQERMGRTMGDVASELGAMEVMLNEAAAGRRMQGLSGPVQNLFTGPMNLETAFATAAAQAGQAYRQAVDAARPGAALMGALPMFAAIDARQGFIQPGFPTSGTDYGNIMSALGQTSSGGLGQLGQLGTWIAGLDWGDGGGDGTTIVGDFGNQEGGLWSSGVAQNQAQPGYAWSSNLV